MPFHPNPVSMAVHAEHHRQELLDQAQQYRLAKEAAGDGGPALRPRMFALKATVAGGVRAIATWRRPALNQPLELPQSAPGEAT